MTVDAKLQLFQPKFFTVEFSRTSSWVAKYINLIIVWSYILGMFSLSVEPFIMLLFFSTVPFLSGVLENVPEVMYDIYKWFLLVVFEGGLSYAKLSKVFIAHLDSVVMDYTTVSYFLADHCKLKLQSSPLGQQKLKNKKIPFTFKKTAHQQFFLLCTTLTTRF